MKRKNDGSEGRGGDPEGEKREYAAMGKCGHDFINTKTLRCMTCKVQLHNVNGNYVVKPTKKKKPKTARRWTANGDEVACTAKELQKIERFWQREVEGARSNAHADGYREGVEAGKQLEDNYSFKAGYDRAMKDMERTYAQYVPTPIPMLLFCPICKERHIDKGRFKTKVHHTHACQHCGHCWRPAEVATVGVQFLPGFKDGDEPSQPNWSELADWARNVRTAIDTFKAEYGEAKKGP